MGIREKEVEVDWDVRSKIFQDCFLLAKIMQTYFCYCFQHEFSPKVAQLILSLPFR